MNSTMKKLFVLAGFALASTLASADDGGDNGMSQWTGDSYAAFYGDTRGHDAYARAEREPEPAKEAKNEDDVKADRVISILTLPTNPFNDNTAA